MSARERRRKRLQEGRNGRRLRLAAGAGLGTGALLGMGANAQAAVDTFVVDRLTDDFAPGGCTAAPTDCSLRQAINLANDGDTTDQDHILFQAGLSGTITLSGPPPAHLPIVDEPLYIDGPGPYAPAVVVSGNNTTNIFLINPGAPGGAGTGADVTIDGLTLSHASTSNFPSAISSFDADLTVKGSTISGNSSSQSFGGGTVASSGAGTTTVQNSTISNNSSTGPNAHGGGLSVQPGAPGGSAGPTTITNSTISGNTLTGENGQGAGVSLQDTNATIQDSTISDNSATNGTYAFGGGVFSNHAFTGGGSMTIQNSTISGNSSNGAGGVLLNFGTNTIQGSYIQNNTSNGGPGGGVWSYYGTTTIHGSTISGNHATGGATYGTDYIPARGGGLGAEGGTVTIRTSTISDNSSEGSGGGFNALYLTTATIERSTISGNHTHNGGDGPGVAADNSDMTIESSTISGNNHLAGGDPEAGGGLYSSSYGATTIRNSTIAGNSADSGGGVYVTDNDAQPEITNSIVADNVAGTGPDLESPNRTFQTAFSLIENTSSAPIADAVPFSNITGVDPQLGALDFNGGGPMTHALAATSPAVDCGRSQGVTTDQRGEVRPFDHPGRTNPNVTGANGADMGAFELIAGAATGACPNNVPPPTPPSISIDDEVVAEGDAGQRAAKFVVSLSQASSQQVTVDFDTSDGTATASPPPGDYDARSGTVTFVPGDTTQPVSVQVNGDTTDELNEDFHVDLSNPTNGTIADGQGTGTIADDDPPAILIADATVNEAAGNAVFTVTRSSATGPSAVDYDDADGTATLAGGDFGQPFDNDASPNDGTLNFLNGESAKTISVPIANDSTDEPNETFFINLTAPQEATIADNQASGTIVDDDVPFTPVPPATTPPAAAPAPTFNLKAAIKKCKKKFPKGPKRTKCIKKAKRRAQA